jgi:ferredoxin
MAKWRVTVSEDCVASGSCLGIAPASFTRGTDGRSYPTSAVIEEDEAVLDAAACCPVEAIRLSDASTGLPIDLP